MFIFIRCGGYRSRTCYPLRELVFETNALPSRPPTYLVHPDHKAFGKLVGPLLDDVFVVDFWAKK